MRLVAPAKLAKVPATMSLESGWTARVVTWPPLAAVKAGSKVESTRPAAVRRTM